MNRAGVRGVRILLSVALVALTVLLAWALASRDMPPLRIWHTERLQFEFVARDIAAASTLDDYLEREERLFRELREKVNDRLEPSASLTFSRYLSGGLQDPSSFAENWNRTFELVPDEVRGGALLLHGLTDSPYSLRRIGEILRDHGYYVLGLRLPGHGTIPGALTRVRWEDWVAASQLGARHVAELSGPGGPFVIAGYSNGGGLAVKYALDSLTHPDLPSPDRLLLFSPEIAVDPLAAIANSGKLLGFVPYFEQFAWLSIEPEFDPYKYNSFPKNAAQEAWEVTDAIGRGIDEARRTGRLAELPPVLTFLSWIDATVRTRATVHELYGQLDNRENELVVFDANRIDRLLSFIPGAEEKPLDRLGSGSDLPYRLTVLTNAAPESSDMVEWSRAARAGTAKTTTLSSAWPQGVYSLSHVAVPFPPDDPVYGAGGHGTGGYHGLPLGALAPRGETHLLTVPVGQLMRLRYNPFFDYLARRVAETAESDIERLSARASRPVAGDWRDGADAPTVEFR